SVDPHSISRLAGAEVGAFSIRRVRHEAGFGLEEVDRLAGLPGEEELPLRVGGARLPGGPAVVLVDRHRPEHRGVLVRGKRAAAFADQEDHRVALGDVLPQLFDKSRRALAKVLLLPHLQLFPPQRAGDLGPIGAELPGDGREEDAIGGWSAHRRSPRRRRSKSSGASRSNGSGCEPPVRLSLAFVAMALLRGLKCMARSGSTAERRRRPSLGITPGNGSSRSAPRAVGRRRTCGGEAPPSRTQDTRRITAVTTARPESIWPELSRNGGAFSVYTRWREISTVTSHDHLFK